MKSSPTSKLIGKLNLMRGGTTDSASAASASEVADEKWDWMTGLPTSVRFVAKSWRPIKRGPGGIVTDPPDSNRARTSVADQDQGWETFGYFTATRGDINFQPPAFLFHSTDMWSTNFLQYS